MVRFSFIKGEQNFIEEFDCDRLVHWKGISTDSLDEKLILPFPSLIVQCFPLDIKWKSELEAVGGNFIPNMASLASSELQNQTIKFKKMKSDSSDYFCFFLLSSLLWRMKMLISSNKNWPRWHVICEEDSTVILCDL